MKYMKAMKRCNVAPLTAAICPQQRHGAQRAAAE
jgi:hypothetical protein